MKTSIKKQVTICLLLGFFFTIRIGYGQFLVTYPEPEANFEKQSNLYKIAVTCGRITKNSFVYVSKASTGAPQWEWQGQEGKTFHFTTFSFSGTATVVVTKLNSGATSATIRPDRIGLGTITTQATMGGKKVSFKINSPRKISVEFNDDPENKNALMVFADPLEVPSDIPKPGSAAVYTVAQHDSLIVPAGKSVVYFAPGVYNINYWRVPTAVKQIYISGGAYVRGYMLANRVGVLSLKINGRGIISNDQWPFHYPQIADPHIPISKDWYKSIVINGGKKHLVEGITMIDGTAFNLVVAADSSTVRNVKINGFRYNNDGITIGGKNAIIMDCFIRVGDDGIVANGAGKYTIRNCIFWHLRGGSCIQLGWRPHVISGTNLIENCDIIHAEWKTPQTQNSGFINYMGTVSGTSNSAIENFTIQNIYFDTEVVKLLDIRLDRGKEKYPINFRNFLFKNIHAKIPANYPGFSVILSGCDVGNKISNFRFSNFYINGTLINQSNYQQSGYFKTGNFVDALIFK